MARVGLARRPPVDAIAAAGHWDDTVFLLTWDDWGGWDDHMATSNVEHTPAGVQLGYSPWVRPGIERRWTSYVNIGRTVLDLLGLPPLGVPRLDQAPGVADLIDPSASPPPGFGSVIRQPTAPEPTPTPVPAPPPGSTSAAVGPVMLRDGSVLPPPEDAPVR
jgi:hypothetical protein